MPLPDLLEALERSNREEISGLLSAARGEAENICSAARSEAEERVGRTLAVERARLRQAGERRRVVERREAAARVLRARTALLDRVFEAARARAGAVLDWPEYATALETWVGRVRELMGADPGTLRCAPADAGRVRAWVEGSSLEVVPSPEVVAGVHLTADGGRLTVDLTVPVRLLLQRPALAVAIGPALEVTG